MSQRWCFPTSGEKIMIHVVEGTSVRSISGKKWYDLARKNSFTTKSRDISRQGHTQTTAFAIKQNSTRKHIRCNIKIQITEYPHKRHIIVIYINFTRRQKMHILNIDLLVLCNLKTPLIFIHLLLIHTVGTAPKR